MTGWNALVAAFAGSEPRRRATRVLGYALIFIGCAGEHWVVAGGKHRASDVDDDGVGSPDQVALDPPRPPPAGICPEAPDERMSTPGCWPSRHVGSWRGFFTGDAAYVARDGAIEHFPLGELALRLGASGSGSLTFGEGTPPAPPSSAGDPYLCAGTAPSLGCPAVHRILEGFAYTLEEVRAVDAGMSAPRISGELPLAIGERLGFRISLGEPWGSWCALQAPDPETCNCVDCGAEQCDSDALGVPPGVECLMDASGELDDEEGCGWLSARDEVPCQCATSGCSARRWSLTLDLQMSADGAALRGWYMPPAGDVPPARLELARDLRP